jgi:hypothetical protein
LPAPAGGVMQPKEIIMKNILILFLAFSSVQVCRGNDQLEGEWEAYSRAGQAVYGKVVIDANSIKWGVPTTNGVIDENKPLPCKAEYSYEFEKEFNLHSFKLKNKECDYANMANSHISKNLSEWKIEIVKERARRLEAKFNDFDEQKKKWEMEYFISTFQGNPYA